MPPPPIPRPDGRLLIVNIPGEPTRQVRSSAWLISLLVHLTALILFSLTYPRGLPGGIPVLSLNMSFGDTAEEGSEPDDTSQTPQFNTSDSGKASLRADPASGPPLLEQILGGPPPVDPRYALPEALAAIGPNGLEGGNVGSAMGAERGHGRKGHSGAGDGKGGGKAQTSVYGVPGEGYRFVYVFDRSGSMGGSGRNALAAAKAELMASLQNLQSNHQFQIIFYNKNPTVFNPSGRHQRLAFATEQNKRLAQRFLGTIIADGGTDHLQALQMALAMKPDVIFLLTDADEPVLGPSDLAKIRRWANGTAINAIEFGYGPSSKPNNFLVRLARQNGGQHGYVDIATLLPPQD